MDGAAVLQIGAQPQAQPVHPAPQAGNGGQVGHGLGGVHVAAVPGVHHRHMGVQGGRLGRALPGGAHDDDVGIAGDHLDGVLQGLSLGNGRGVRIGEAEHRPAQAQHGGLEGEVGAGGGLVKQIARHPALTHVHKLDGSSMIWLARAYRRPTHGGAGPQNRSNDASRSTLLLSVFFE